MKISRENLGTKNPAHAPILMSSFRPFLASKNPAHHVVNFIPHEQHDIGLGEETLLMTLLIEQLSMIGAYRQSKVLNCVSRKNKTLLIAH